MFGILTRRQRQEQNRILDGIRRAAQTHEYAPAFEDVLYELSTGPDHGYIRHACTVVCPEHIPSADEYTLDTVGAHG